MVPLTGVVRSFSDGIAVEYRVTLFQNRAVAQKKWTLTNVKVL